MGLSTERYSLWKVALGAIVFEYKDLINKYLEKGFKIKLVIITKCGSKDNYWNRIKMYVMRSVSATMFTSEGALAFNFVIGIYVTNHIKLEKLFTNTRRHITI
ncbi:hypothetical protein [Clostridium botulinum]|uniref:hypothetical protein n=1 Tax=Clostridium botulinum TaxID=1491 RepID=UPI003DA54290